MVAGGVFGWLQRGDCLGRGSHMIWYLSEPGPVGVRAEVHVRGEHEEQRRKKIVGGDAAGESDFELAEQQRLQSRLGARQRGLRLGFQT